MSQRSAKEIAAAVAASLLAAAIGFGLAVLVFQRYTAALFLGVPFAMGFFAVTAANLWEWREDFARITVVAVLGPFLSAFALRIEGAICLVMAAVLVLPMALLGGFVAQRIGASRGAATFMAIAPLGAIFGEQMAPPPVPEREVRTAVIVNAPPAAVWRHVVSFSQLPPPKELLFRAGVAYPIRAEISGTGPGAVRRCVFSTGAFVEPITVWDAPRKLAFDVEQQPPAMRELSFWEVDAPHLNGYFRTTRGQFELTPLPGGKTKLEGTTWYSYRISPEFYWRLWTEHILHRVHERVLLSIAERAERTQ